MVVRLKEPDIKRIAWDWINISDNHVISVLLRAENNLIHVNDDRELYVDLQLDDWILPDDDFPVGVTTGKILAEDWWPQSWLILNWKTTSWDYNRFIYANDGNLYFDPGTWNWILLGEWVASASNVKAFKISGMSDSVQWQAIVDWYLMWKYPIVWYNGNTYVVDNTSVDWRIRFINTFTTIYHMMNAGTSYTGQNRLYVVYDVTTHEFDNMSIDVEQISPTVVAANRNYDTPFNPTTPWDPATKKYVDDWLALKQDKLTAGTRITIDANNVISADMSSIFIYKGNVTDPSDLPSSWQSVWDAYFSESDSIMYAWDWTQWKDIWSIATDLTNYFNKTTDDSDDITQWTTNLFVTQSEKNTWNAKQDALTAWTWITINNNVIADVPYTSWTWIAIDANRVITNTRAFEPENQWAVWLFLQKTSTWYKWIQVQQFNPENNGSVGQVLKKTSTWYSWQNESWGWSWGWGGWWNFNPENTWTLWQVLTKTADGYAWMTSSSNIKCFELNFPNGYTQADLQEIIAWVNQGTDYGAVIKTLDWAEIWDVYLYSNVQNTAAWLEYCFFGTKIYRSPTWPAGSQTSQFTQLWNGMLKITWNNGTYTVAWDRHNDVANFIECVATWYNEAFMPTQDYQPATKKYVDNKERHGTQAQYNQLWTYEQWKVYNILS